MALFHNNQHHPAAQRQDDSDKERGGFDCELVECLEVDNLQTECPVCLLIIREPHQVTCCGKRFCQSCIECLKDNNKPCPTCKKEDIANFPDKGLKQTMHTLEVHCSHQKDGCEWTGELGQLYAHLNEDPEPGKELEGCQYAEYRCQCCDKKIQRQHMQDHKTKHCTKRSFSCEHCNNYESNYDDVIHNHWPVCGCFPLPCPNQCGVELPRREVNSHVYDECPLTTITCDFLYIGCTTEVPRKDMPAHLRDNLLTHMSLLAASHTKQQNEIKRQQEKIFQQQKDISMQEARIDSLVQENERLKSKNKTMEYNFNSVTASFTILEAHFSKELQALREDNTHLKKEMDTLQQEILTKKSTLHSTVPIGPLILPLTNFTQRKKSLDPWYSLPFYTHAQGYKLCLGVYANFPTRSVSVFMHFMQGEFDDSLKWPFRGVISFRLLDQAKGVDHKTHSVIYDDSVEGSVCGRVTGKERGEKGRGKQRFIAHSELEPKYLQNNTLLFQIHKVEL